MARTQPCKTLKHRHHICWRWQKGMHKHTGLDHLCSPSQTYLFQYLSLYRVVGKSSAKIKGRQISFSCRWRAAGEKQKLHPLITLLVFTAPSKGGLWLQRGCWGPTQQSVPLTIIHALRVRLFSQLKQEKRKKETERKVWPGLRVQNPATLVTTLFWNFSFFYPFFKAFFFPPRI